MRSSSNSSTTEADRNSAEPRGAVRIRWPAEWEPHEATWLSWPHNRETWPGCLDAVEAVFGLLVRELSYRERVCINVADDAMAERVQAVLRGAGVEASAPVHFFEIPTDDAWVRDHGGIFVLLEEDAGSEKVLVDFRFNAWGGKYPPWDRDAAVAGRMAQAAGVRCLEADFTLEGGSVEGNGEGTVLTTASCLLDPNRGPGRTRESMEWRLAQSLGATQVHWLARGIDGDDTDGHIDVVARFAGVHTIVAAVTDDPSHPAHGILRDNLLRLRSLRRPDGGSFEVVGLPVPRVGDGGHGSLPASYANFFVANGAVLVPRFGQADDDRAMAVLAEVFAGRDVIAIPSRELVVGLGGIHCLTQQEPVR